MSQPIEMSSNVVPYTCFSDVQEYVNSSEASMYDEMDGLKLFCYNEINQGSDEMLKRIRGVVFDENENIVSRTFGATIELIFDGKFDKEFFYPFEGTTNAFYSEEGTLLRLFNHNGKWYLSTHKKLDAQKSRWGAGKTFGELFKEGLMYSYMTSVEFRDFMSIDTQDESVVYEKFLEKLDTQYTYLFLVKSTTKNRIVCTKVSEVGNILYLGKIYNSSQTFEGNDDFHFLMRPVKVDITEDFYESLKEQIENVDYKSHQGIILFNDDFTSSVKLINKNYGKRMNLRSNCPSVKFRYMELLHSKDMEKLRDFRDLYPEYSTDFDTIDTIIYNIATKAHRVYLDRHINKQFVVTDPDLHVLLKNVHNMYVSNKVPTTVMMVREKLLEMTPVYINRVVKKFKDMW